MTGVALFSAEGQLLGSWQLKTTEATWGMRLCDLANQFAELPIEHDKITEVAVECLKGAANSPMLNCISGIFIQFLPNAVLRAKSFITPSAWKGYVRKTTKEKAPKGCYSLQLLHPEMSKVAKTEDEADAIMLGLTYIHTRR